MVSLKTSMCNYNEIKYLGFRIAAFIEVKITLTINLEQTSVNPLHID